MVNKYKKIREKLDNYKCDAFTINLDIDEEII